MDYNAPRALELLRRGSGRPNAQFRECQGDAIRHIVVGNGNLLVVPKTGLGQELCLFYRCQIAAGKLRRDGRPGGTGRLGLVPQRRA